MDFEQILNLATVVLGALPLELVETLLQVVGGSALIAAGVSKKDSQYKTKAGKIFGTVINLLGANFGKAKNVQ